LSGTSSSRSCTVLEVSGKLRVLGYAPTSKLVINMRRLKKLRSEPLRKLVLPGCNANPISCTCSTSTLLPTRTWRGFNKLPGRGTDPKRTHWLPRHSSLIKKLAESVDGMLQERPTSTRSHLSASCGTHKALCMHVGRPCPALFPWS